MAMDIRTFLAPENALLEVEASDKARLLKDLSTFAATRLRMPADQIAEALRKREELGSTGVGNGAAIPHGRIAGLEAPFGILARLRKPIAFDAIDGEPVDMVFAMLLPTSTGDDQLKALAAVARKLREPAMLKALRGADDSAALYAAIISSGVPLNPSCE
jgi:PTS system nitrogen regulatory IIA component